jgi:hypothetical protein
MSVNKNAVVAAWSDERAAAQAARSRGDQAGEWRHLERAHILSQPLAVPHVRTNAAMLGAGLRAPHSPDRRATRLPPGASRRRSRALSAPAAHFVGGGRAPIW